jgi:formylglycine-generating enzyme required for sulfatase activity
MGGGGASGTGGAAGTTGSGGGGGGGTGPCGNLPPIGPSCDGLPDTCGPGGNENCCDTRCVPGGSFTLGRVSGEPDDLACQALSCDAEEAPGVPATIRAFYLDRFEVTVGRFRKFVSATIAGYKPQLDSGKHGYLNGGSESGWDSSFTLPSIQSVWNSYLSCSGQFPTWTPSPGANENKPITCVAWTEAYAFCIWDGGFLPTEAEWELAASGGEERVFPWSTPPADTTIGPSHACYAPACGAVRAVGQTPAGDGRWGHADLAGNVWELLRDRYVAPYPPGGCNDCANLSLAGFHVSRGGAYNQPADAMRATKRGGENDTWFMGVRCAKTALVGR